MKTTQAQLAHRRKIHAAAIAAADALPEWGGSVAHHGPAVAGTTAARVPHDIHVEPQAAQRGATGVKR